MSSKLPDVSVITKAWLMFLLVLWTGTAVFASPAVKIVIKEKEGFQPIECEIIPKQGLSFGLIPSVGKKTLELLIENRLPVPVKLEGWRSPCTCLIFSEVPETLKPGDQRKITTELDGAAYFGSFSKHMYLAFETDKDNCDAFLPINFSVEEQTRQLNPKAGDSEIISGVRYSIVKDPAERSLDSPAAWLFASPTCPSCNFLKRKILPAIFSDKSGKIVPEVVIADLGEKPNVVLLIELEKYYGIKNNKTPVLFCRGHFFHGENAIKKLRREDLPAPGTPIDFCRKISASDSLKKHAEKIKLSAVIIGGLTDGINPCVFTTLIFFISLLTISGIKQKKLFMVGAVYCLACFICYTLLGLGLFSTLKVLSAYKWVQQIFNIGLIAVLVLFALLSFRDAFRFKKSGKTEDVALQLPDSLKSRIHAVMRKGLKAKYLLPGAFIIGIFVTLIESVCTGQVYIPVLALMIKDHSPESLKWVSYLLLYNLMFIIPLVVIFICVWRGTSQSSLLNWSRQNVVFGKIAMGVFFLLLAGVMIWFL